MRPRNKPGSARISLRDMGALVGHALACPPGRGPALPASLPNPAGELRSPRQAEACPTKTVSQIRMARLLPAVAAAALCLAAVAVRAQQDAPTVFRTDTRVVVCNT